MTFAVACPDKYKGTLTAAEAAAAIARGLRRGGYEEVRELPLADGGEGTLDALRAGIGGRVRRARVTGPLGAPVEAEWLVLPDGTAVVEVARAIGLQLVAGRNDALRASSKGAGELILAAAREGATRLVVAVGGVATTDGGLGAVTALGWSLARLDVTVAYDVRTRFVDAAAVYGPQKGASSAQVGLLTRRLEKVGAELAARTGVDVTGLDGSGAAGGLGGGLAALGARLRPGFDVVAEAADLERVLDGAELVVTGEGRLDATSFEGKTVSGVLDWAAELGVPRRAVVAGQVAAGLELPAGVRAWSLTERAYQGGDAFARAGLLLEEAAVELAHTDWGSTP